MTNREMAIRLAAATIEQMLKHDNTYAQKTLEVLKAEISNSAEPGSETPAYA